VGGTVASWLVCWSPSRVIWAQGVQPHDGLASHPEE